MFLGSEAERRAATHVVMLVDNIIVGDSRVQKQARSMAARGWRVTLVGTRRRSVDPRELDFDGVPAKMLYVARRAGANPALERRSRLTAPLTYTTDRRAAHADGRADAALDDAEYRIAQLRAAGSGGVALLLARARVRASALRRRTVDVRLRRTEAVRARRATGTGLVVRARTRWWTAVKGDRVWSHLDPGLWDWELAFGPMIDKLAPDLIHANDHRMLSVAARAKLRAAALGRDVRIVWDAHEYIPGIKPWSADVRWHEAQIALERVYAPYADAVTSVSEVLGDMLVADHGLDRRPRVVLNAPLVDPVENRTTTDVRTACGLGPETPLIVYSGGATPARGLDVVIEALPDLPGTHVALVVLRTQHTTRTEYVEALVRRAEELGVADRLHLLPYVPAAEVVSFLSTADLGVFPGLRYLNHTISLITKFFEYSHAHLPIVVSEVKTMAETVRATGQGEVFEPGDVAGFVAAVTAVLADPARYRRAYDDAELMASWTWERQADVLDAVYLDTLNAHPEKLDG